MNILAELLPGTRQLRAPLAVGYLWLLVGWINAPHFSSNERNSALVARAATDLSHLNPALVILIVSFSAYIIGLFFEVLGDLIIKTAVAVIAIIILLLILVLAGVIVWRHFYLPAVVWVSAVAYFAWRSHHYDTSIEAEVNQSMVNAWIRVQFYYAPLKRLAWNVWAPSTPVKNSLISEQVLRLLDAHPDIQSRFCETLSVPALRVACMEAGLGSTASKSATATPEGQVANLTKVASRSSIDPKGEQQLRQYLSSRLAASAEVRRAVVLSVMILKDIKKEVERALNDAQARIQADKPTVFEAYDRLRADADFRRGISIPLGVALISVCLLYTRNMYAAIAVAAPVAVIYFSGMKKEEEAAKVVTHSVSAQITTIRLEVTDVALLRWPIQNVHNQIPVVITRLLVIPSLRNQVNRLHRQRGQRGEKSIPVESGPGDSEA